MAHFEFGLIIVSVVIPNFRLMIYLVSMFSMTLNVNMCVDDPFLFNKGDSGGPVIQLLDGKWVVIALVSFGYQCGTVPKRQAGHTKVSSFIPYVQSCELNAINKAICKCVCSYLHYFLFLVLNGSAYHVDRGNRIS